MSSGRAVWWVLLLIVGLCAPCQADEKYVKAAPWDDIRFTGDRIEVHLPVGWRTLVSIDGIAVNELAAFSKQTYTRKWQKRIAEDLVEVMGTMGKRPGPTVTLVTRDGTAAPVTHERVRMSRANRERIENERDAAEQGSPRAPPKREVQRVKREHVSVADPRFAALTRRLKSPLPGGDLRLSAEHATEDLDQLEWHLANEFSYLTLRQVDYRAALDTIRLGIGEGIARADLTLQLHRLVCLFGDGHSRIRGLSREVFHGPELPVPLAAWAGRVLLASPDTRDGSRAWAVQSIDGQPIKAWLAAVADIVPHGSPTYRAQRQVRELRRVTYARDALGLPHAGDLTLGLVSVDGKRTHTHMVGLGTRYRGPRRAPPISFKRHGKVGYLRISEMTGAPDQLAIIDEAMAAFRETAGLVIDVRGNGGGTRDALRRLFPYFLRKQELHLVNVAALRMPPGLPLGAPEGYLRSRFAFPETASVWRGAERKQVQDLLKSFTPDWKIPAGAFSAWHVMPLRRAASPKAYGYANRVVLLIDGGCFSATDIFVGAFKGWRGVTVMGTPTGGGSGRSQRGALANSRIRFRLSSMASFRPSGARYDGKGIAPDIQVVPTPEDLGSGSDSVLERALKTAGKALR